MDFFHLFSGYMSNLVYFACVLNFTEIKIDCMCMLKEKASFNRSEMTVVKMSSLCDSTVKCSSVVIYICKFSGLNGTILDAF